MKPKERASFYQNLPRLLPKIQCNINGKLFLFSVYIFDMKFSMITLDKNGLDHF